MNHSTQKSCRIQGSQLLLPALALVSAVSTLEGSTGPHGSHGFLGGTGEQLSWAWRCCERRSRSWARFRIS